MAFLVTLVQLVLLIPTAVIGLVLHLLTSLLDSALLVVAPRQHKHPPAA
jgi:hypothetical protein